MGSRHGGLLLRVVALHLVVAEYEVLECFDVRDRLQLVAVGFYEVVYKGFDVFALDQFEQFEADGVEEVIAGHGFVDDVEDRGE